MISESSNAERRPRPLLGPYAPSRHCAAFPHPPSGLQSVALVPLQMVALLSTAVTAGFTVTVAEVMAEQPLLLVTVTLYTVVVAGATTTLWVLPVPAGAHT